MGHTTRAAAAAVLAGAVVMTAAACGGGGGDDKGGAKPSSSASTGGAAGSSGSSDSSGSGDGTPSATPTQVLAQLKGEQNVIVTINSAVRDSGGFVTIQGVIDNEGTEKFNGTDWSGPEVALANSGASVAGAVLVDEAGKKRYYVLRDTEGRCLCTMGLIGVKPKETRPFFAQFPAPPSATTEVQFELPTMPPAKITLSDAEG